MYQSTHTGAQVDDAVDKALSADAVPTASSQNLVESGGVFSAMQFELLKSGTLSGSSTSESYSTNGHSLIILELYGNQSNTLWWAIPTARFASTYGTTVGFPFDIPASSAIYVRGNISIGATSISVSNFASGVWSSVAFRIWGVL